MAKWPQSSTAVFSQEAIVKIAISQGNIADANSAAAKLVTDFSGHENIDVAVYDLTEYFRTLQKYIDANQPYQDIIDNWLSEEYVTQTQIDAAKLDIVLLIKANDDANALTAVDSFIADFNDSLAFSKAISDIEEAYYLKILPAELAVNVKKIYFRNAISIWEKTLAKFPDFFYNTPDLYYFLACGYYQLGEYENAIEHYSIVLNNWPKCNYTNGAQNLINDCFQKLEEPNG